MDMDCSQAVLVPAISLYKDTFVSSMRMRDLRAGCSIASFHGLVRVGAYKSEVGRFFGGGGGVKHGLYNILKILFENVMATNRVNESTIICKGL